MKRLGLFIMIAASVVLVGVAGYFFVASNTIELDEGSPLDIKDNILTMDAETRSEFEAAVKSQFEDIIKDDLGNVKLNYNEIIIC